MALEMFTICCLWGCMTQIQSFCFQVEEGTVYFAEILICGGDFYLC